MLLPDLLVCIALGTLLASWVCALWILEKIEALHTLQELEELRCL
jgi:hypothetical protein